MILGITIGSAILATGIAVGYWLGKPNKVTTSIKRKVFSQKARIIDPTNPLDLDLGN